MRSSALFTVPHFAFVREALTAPAYEDIATFPTKVEDDGVLYVRDNRFD